MTHTADYYFLSRPRRFGKSLLISTLEYYFFKIQSVFFYFTNSHNSAIIRTMTDELFSTIKNELAKKTETESKAVKKKTTWLIFTLQNQQYYALPASSVKEIIRDTQVFPLPFAPRYFKGVVNRYGDPYAIVDPALIMGENEQKSSIYIVINDETHTCFQICDVKDFYSASESELVPFAQSDTSDFFEGTITFKNKSVLVLNISTFLQKVEQEIATQ